MNALATSPTLSHSANVEVKKYYEKGKNYLHFSFKDKFTFDDSIQATSKWGDFCKKDQTEKFIHIWECQHMTGFDSKAKSLWMEYMEKYFDQTEKIILVSDNIIIRGAARIMSKFTKHPLTIYKSLSEMKQGEL